MSMSLSDRNFFAEHEPLVLQLQPALSLSDEQLLVISRLNRTLRLERNADGALVVLPLAGCEASARCVEVLGQLANWAKKDGTGQAFDSSAGFRLPNTAVLSPDASWVPHARLNQFTPEQKEKFLPLCPDFVVEVLSPSDSLAALKDKMQEYIDQGARLGLLIDGRAKRVYVYSPGQAVQEITGQDRLSCDPVLPGFELVLTDLW